MTALEITILVVAGGVLAISLIADERAARRARREAIERESRRQRWGYRE